jgi:hypothetical protein
VTGAEGVAGDMPRDSQFGYLFKGATPQTIAHEIGHGVFHLDHPFARANGAKSFADGDLTDNLMQYHDGTNLVKLQWDAMHAPGLVIGVFEMDKDAMSHYVKNATQFLEWIKTNKGKKDINYKKYQFYDGTGRFDVPVKVDNPDITFYVEFGDDGTLDLEKNDTGGFAGLGVSFDLNKNYHNGFYLTIKYANTQTDAITIWFYSYEDFSKFFEYLGLTLTQTAKDNIVASYKKAIQAADNDCNKLDVIYETIPDFVITEIDDETLFAHLSILSQCQMNKTVAKIVVGKSLDTDEEQAALTILNHIKDKTLLYNKLYDNPKVVIDLYTKINTDDNQKALIQLFEDVCKQYWDNHEEIVTDVYNIEHNFYILPNVKNHGSKNQSSISLWGVRNSGGISPIDYMPKSSAFNPFEPVFVSYSDAADLNERQQFIYAIPAIGLLYLADKQEYKDSKEAVSFFLQVLSIYASAYAVTEATGTLSKAIGWAGLLNESTRIFANNDNVRTYLESQPWGEDFMKVYSSISTGVDIATIVHGGFLAIKFNADEVRNVLKSNNIGADDLAKYDEVVDAVKVWKFTQKQIDEYVAMATKNPNAKKVMLGKYADDATSYTKRSGNDHTYFDLGEDWNKIKVTVNSNDYEMWRINKQFIENAKKNNKEFLFSHDPRLEKEDSFLLKEYNLLIEMGGKKDLIKIEDNLWKMEW